MMERSQLFEGGGQAVVSSEQLLCTLIAVSRCKDSEKFWLQPLEGGKAHTDNPKYESEKIFLLKIKRKVRAKQSVPERIPEPV